VHTTQSSGLEGEEESSPADDDTPNEFQNVGIATSAPSIQGISKIATEQNEPQNSGVIETQSPTEDRLTGNYASVADPRPLYDPMETESFFTSDPPTVPSEDRESYHSSISAFPVQRERYPLGPLKGLPESCTDKYFTEMEEACLIRHFTEDLAPWVSLT
jgi:hypothetical protein